MFKTLNKHSIFFSFFIVLSISILLVIGSFKLLLEHNKNYHISTTQERYFPLARLIDKEYYNYGLTNNLITAIKDMGYTFTNNKKQIDTFFKDKTIKFLTQRENNLHMVALFTDKKNNYIYFQTPFDEFLIVDKDIEYNDDSTTISIAFSLILLTLLVLAYTIYKKLLPLKRLKDEIKDISKGSKKVNYDFVKKNQKDEVSQLVYEFENTINELYQIKEARNIFIRNIMHELKTPITKGRFLVELPSGEKNKELLKKVFFRLESLIEEFASIEEVIAKKEDVEKKSYLLDDILDNAIDLLYLDDSQINYETNNLKIDVNFKLFTIVLKNLIDNGIKYSTTHKITIETKENKILFISEGDKLKKPLEEYLKPFNQGSSKDKDFQETKSFGLGLYIVQNILTTHNMKLSYIYAKKTNIFVINL